MQYNDQPKIIDFLNDVAECPVCGAPLSHFEFKESTGHAKATFRCQTVSTFRRSLDAPDKSCPWVVESTEETVQCLRTRLIEAEAKKVPLKQVKKAI